MKEIEYPLSHTTVAEACTLSINSSIIIKKHGIEDEYLNQLGDMLETQGNEMENSIATSRKKALSEKVVEADNKRNGAFRALKSFIKSYFKWNTEKYTLSAEKIWDVLKRHGLNLDQKTYEQESGLLKSLLIELDKPEMVEAITTLNLTELITFLKDSQKEFSAIYYSSIEEEAGKEIVIAASTLKKDAYSTLKKTVGYLNSSVYAKPEVYKDVHGEMAELINNLNQKVRIRRRKK